ncbi:MAG: hypothetical protein HRU13_14340 [Phycisphaerales bacterium]|nr:hypothetical protein [Phycisphaerales bacterium]
MKRRPRVISVRAVVVSLLFAVVVAVGSVPLLAWRAQHAATLYGWPGTSQFEFDDPSATRTTVSHRSLLGYTDWMHAPTGSVWGTRPPAPVPSDPRPSWARPVSEPWPTWHFANEAGFPFKSARGWYEVPSTGRQIIGPFFLSDRPSRMMSIHTNFGNDPEVPIVPLWSGLIANTLVFFAIPFVPWTILRHRRLARIERLGLCYKCRYEFPRDIKTCPECGTTRPRGREDS